MSLGLPQHLEAKISPEPNSGCWLWCGSHDQHGYGGVRIKGIHYRAHRVVFECLSGSIPSGLELDHKCRLPACVNPDHLEPVTHRTNMLRGKNVMAHNHAKMFCAQGHSLIDAYIRKGSGHRLCRSCQLANQKRIRAQRKGLS